MNIELKQYRRLHLSYEELCVAAALLELPCLYGVAERWLKQTEEMLPAKVTRLVGAMEKKGLVFLALDGSMEMEPALYGMICVMSQSELLGRIRYLREERKAKLYLYGKGGRLLFLEDDGRDGCYLGDLPHEMLMKKLLKEIPAQKPAGEEEDLFGMILEQWLTAIVFERKDGFYEPCLDLAWREYIHRPEEKKELADCWQQLCRCVWRKDP